MECSPRQLFDVIDRVCLGIETPAAADFRSLLQSWTPTFLSVLQEKGPNAASRQQVESQNPATKSGHTRLDPQDVQEVLLLSQEFNLDELDSLEYLLDAHERGGDVSAEAAGGVFFEQRKSLLLALRRLLAVQANNDPRVPDGIFEVVCSFNGGLLAVAAGRKTLVSHLVEKFSDTSLEAKGDSKMTQVVNAQGHLEERHTLLQIERSLLCECLVFATSIQPRQPPEDIAAAADLLQKLSLRVRGSDLGDLTTQQQANAVLVSLVHMLLPKEIIGNDPLDEADLDALTEVAKNNSLAGKLEQSGPPENGYVAALCLAWGVLLAAHAPPNFRNRADETLTQAVAAGVFGFLHTGIMQTAAFEDEAPELRELYAQSFNHLLMDYLETDSFDGALDVMIQTSYDVEDAAAGSQLTSQADEGRERGDGVHDFLLLLADIYTTYPELWQNEELKYDIFGDFMGQLHAKGVLQHAALVLEAYLKVLGALATTQQGAGTMYLQMQQDPQSVLSWTRMLNIMKAICSRYSMQPSRQGLGLEGGTSQQRNTELILPDKDAAGLAAYLQLFTRVFSNASLSETETWVAELEARVQVQHLWDLFFQLMCHPVPQKLKAALDDALCTFARQPGNVPPMFDRLLRSVVVQPRSLQDASSLSRADISYQLNEIEARAEDYMESIAFVRLLNVLLKASGGALPDEGRPYGHFQEFVRQELLGQINQRGYKSESQKWELMEVCLINLQIWLENMGPDAAASTAGAQITPALAVLLDLLGERQGMKALLSLVLQGPDRLAQERKDSPAGGAKEGAVLAALQLVRTALERDIEVVDAFKAAQRNVYCETLEVVLQQDHRRTPIVLEYVRYPHSVWIQEEAIRIAQFLAARVPNLVDQILPPLASGEAGYVHIRSGFAAALDGSLNALGLPGRGESSSDGRGEDKRASLIMELLLHASQYASQAQLPTFTHMLLGFDVEDGAEGIYRSHLEPQRSFTCLSVIIQALDAEWLPAAKPQLYAHMLELVHILAEDPLTSHSVLSLLRQHAFFSHQLDPVVCSPLPDEEDRRIWFLQQRATLLQIIALELHHADAAVPQHRASLTLLLQDFFCPPEPLPGGRQRLSRRAEALQLVVSSPVEPQLAIDPSADMGRLRQSLDLDNQLAAHKSDQSGISGQLISLYDIPALTRALQLSYHEAEQENRRFGDGGKAANAQLGEACGAALRYAQQYNAFASLLAAQQAAVSAWQTVVELSVSRRYDILDALAMEGAASGPAEGLSGSQLVHGLLHDTLDMSLHLAQGTGIAFVPPLAKVIRSLLSRLQQQAVNNFGVVDILSGSKLPSRMHASLQKMLHILRHGHQRVDIRLPLYGALLSYLHISKPVGTSSVPPAVLTAVLSGLPQGSSVSQAVEELDNLQSQLDTGNSELILEDSFLVQLLASDAAGLTGHAVARMLALTLLGVLVAADASGGVTASVFATGLPERVLHDLASVPHQAFYQVGPKAQGVVHVIMSQAAVLLELMRSTLGLTTQPAGSLVACTAILSKMTACQVFDLQPEDPGMEGSFKADTLRARLAKVLPSLLRLVSLVLVSLPDSRQVREAGAAFVEAHHKALLRILREAASPAIRGWSAGVEELEQAALVLNIVSCLTGVDAHMPTSSSQLKAAIYLLTIRFAAPNARSMIPAVSGLADSQADLQPEGVALASSVYEVRAALAKYLRGASMHAEQPVVLRIASGQPGSPDSMTPTLLLLSDMLKQAMGDLFQALETNAQQLQALGNVSRASLVPLPAEDSSIKTKQKRGQIARLSLLQAAETSSNQAAKLAFLIGNILAVLICHTGRHMSDIGTPQDVDQLRRRVVPCLDPLAQMLESPALTEQHKTSLQTLTARLKDSLPSR